MKDCSDDDKMRRTKKKKEERNKKNNICTTSSFGVDVRIAGEEAEGADVDGRGGDKPEKKKIQTASYTTKHQKDDDLNTEEERETISQVVTASSASSSSSSTTTTTISSSFFPSPLLLTGVLLPWLSKTIACPIESIKLRNQLLVSFENDGAGLIRATKCSAFAGNEANLLRLFLVQSLEYSCKRPYKHFFRNMFSKLKKKHEKRNEDNTSWSAAAVRGAEKAARTGGVRRRRRRRRRREEASGEGPEAVAARVVSKRQQLRKQRSAKFWWHFLEWFAVSASSSVTATMLLYPLDTYRTRSAVGLTTNMRSIRSLYGNGPGVLASVLGSITYRTIFFLLYNWSHRRTDRKKETSDVVGSEEMDGGHHTIVGVCVRVVVNLLRRLLRNPFLLSSLAGFLVFPFDTVRRLNMINPNDSIRRLVRNHGFARVLWAGAWENFVRTAVEGAVLRIAMPVLISLGSSSSGRQ